MFCPKCGAQIADGSNFCTSCGVAFVRTAAVPPPRPTGIVRNSGMAVASLVLGLVGLFVIPPSSILAIIFGAVAMNQTNKNPNLKGKGMALAGLVLGIVAIVFWVILIVILASANWWVEGNYY